MKTSLRFVRARGLVPFFPPPSPLMPLFIAKSEKRGGRGVSSADYRETRAAQPPPTGRRHAVPSTRPAARGKCSQCPRHGKCGGSPGPRGEHKPAGLCSTLSAPKPPEFPYFLPVAAAPEGRASRCAGASPPAPLQPATAEPGAGAARCLLWAPVG